MAGKQQPWLISYCYQARFARTDDGGTSAQPPQDTIGIIDCPPWKFVAQSKIECNNAYKPPYAKSGTRMPDDILRIYWAVQLPIRALTEEEIDILS